MSDPAVKGVMESLGCGVYFLDLGLDDLLQKIELQIFEIWLIINDLKVDPWWCPSLPWLGSQVRHDRIGT